MPVFITQPMIQFLAIELTALSAFFFVWEVIVASPQNLSELAKSKWDYNLNLVKTLSKQKADAIFGFLFLVTSALLQGINLLFPARFIDFEGLTIGTLMILVIILAIIFIWSLKMNKKYAEKTEGEILKALGIKQ